MDFFGYVPGKIIGLFTRQLAAMLSAGLPLSKSLSTIIEQTEHPRLKVILGNVTEDVKAGKPLAESLKKHPCFSTLYCSMVSVGEASGSLDGVLVKLASYLEKQEKTKQKIITAMTYPAIIFAVSIVVLIALFTFVIPNFMEMFTDFGKQLPASTEFVIKISGFVSDYLLFIALGFALLLGFVVYCFRNPALKSGLDSFLLSLPLVGDLIRKSAISRFSDTLGTLLDSGVSLIEAMRITASTSGNRVVEKAILKSLQNITGGKEIAGPLKETGVFPPMVTQMVTVGEETGSLSKMLHKISEFYNSEVDSSVDRLTSILEPLMMVLLGIIVAGLLIAMYLPMFDMIGEIK